MIESPVESISKEHIDALVTYGVPESRTIEYKLELPARHDSGTKEFLADVTAFANSSGGDIIFGIREDAALPVEALGVSVDNIDDEILRLQNILTTSVAPRIHGVSIRFINGFPNGPILLIRIPRSWSGPHMVTAKGSSKFFVRTNGSKHQMDVQEIRSAFLQSDSLDQKLKDFRAERVGRILAGDAVPVSLPATAKTILHLVPFSAFSQAPIVSPDDLRANHLITGGGNYSRFNLDGFLSTVESSQGGSSVFAGYAQTYRSGIIEAVDAELLRDRTVEQPGRIASAAWEERLIEWTSQAIQVFKSLEVAPPVALMVSLTGVRGYQLIVAPKHRGGFYATPIDRDVVFLSEVIFESLEIDAGQLLRPVFDSLWNACGYACCRHYNEAGEWVT